MGKKKIQRLADIASLYPHASLSVVVDDERNVVDISNCMAAAEKVRAQRERYTGARKDSERGGGRESAPMPSIGVLIEINGGQNRCGVSPFQTEKIVSLAHKIQEQPLLQFKGIQCYGGNLQHVRSAEERGRLVKENVVSSAEAAMRALAAAGIDCEIVTGGGTGTFPFEVSSGCYTEIQPGSYCLMDVDYCANHDSMFEPALFIHSTIISDAVQFVQGRQVVIDAGVKAISFDSGMPVLTDQNVNFGLTSKRAANVEYKNGGCEHGILTSLEGSGEVNVGAALQVGGTVRLIPGHVDPTVNMHNWLVCVRSTHDAQEPEVVAVWDISARNYHF